MILFNSGCSYTTPNTLINQKDMYWYKLSNYLHCDCAINESKPGSSNDLIIRRVYNHVLKNINLDTFYLIGLTSLNRIELNQEGSETFIEILTNEAIAKYDFETMELTAYAQIIGIVSFLNQYKKPFYIVNNSTPFIDGYWDPRNEFIKFVKSEKRILNLYENSRVNFHKNNSKIKPYDYDQYGWNGHDCAIGHDAYFNFLVELIEKDL